MNENSNLKNQNIPMGENSLVKKLLKKRLNQKGLTLIELLAVIVILAIVAAIAVPAIGNIINNSRDKAILGEAANIIAGAKLADTEGACDLDVAASAATACDEGTLGNYVDGVESAATYTVTRSGGENSINFSRFSAIKDTTKYAITNNTVTETQLNTFLD